MVSSALRVSDEGIAGGERGRAVRTAPMVGERSCQSRKGPDHSARRPCIVTNTPGESGCMLDNVPCAPNRPGSALAGAAGSAGCAIHTLERRANGS